MWLTVKGKQVLFEREGSGTPLLLVHGISHGLGIFDSIVPLLSQHFDVIRYSQPGIDGSDTLDEPLTMSLLGEQCVDVLDALGIQTAIIMGVSFGGWVIQSAVHHHPDRFQACILGCSYSAMASHRIAPPPERLQQFNAIFNEEIADTERAQGFLGLFYDAPFRQRFPNLKDIIAESFTSQPFDKAVMEERLRVAGGFDLQGPVITNGMPALAMSGAHDLVVPPENLAMLAEYVPVQTTVTVPDTGHCFFQEAPHEVAKTMIDFLGSQSHSH